MERMETIRRCADLSVRRGCGFAGLGIFCMVVGLSFDPFVAAKSGAILCSLMAMTLALMAGRATARPYRRTEVFIMLDRKTGLPDEVAQRLVGEALRDSLFQHAELAALVALGLWIVAGVAWAVG